MQFKENLKIRWGEARSAWYGLDKMQKVSLAVLIFFLVALPVSLLVIVSPIKLFSRADYPITPPITNPIPPVSGTNKSVFLTSQNSHISLMNSASINPKLGWTVEAWIKPNSATSGGWIINKDIQSDQSFAMNVRQELVDTVNGIYSGVYTFSVANSGNRCVSHNIEQQLQYGLGESGKLTSWMHIAGVVQNDGTLDIFVNGKRSESNFNKVGGTCPNSLPIEIGAIVRGESSDGVFDGLIDEVRISNVARYTSNFDPQHNPFVSDASTLALYHFDSDFSDASGNGHVGVLTGNAEFKDGVPPEAIQTPVPSPVCKYGVNNFAVNGPICGKNKYNGAKYTCYDGYTGTLGGRRGDCRSSDAWKSLAESACKDHGQCYYVSPVPIGTLPGRTTPPTPVATFIATPAPTGIPIGRCNSPCLDASIPEQPAPDCGPGYECISQTSGSKGVCRNASCPNDLECDCLEPKPTNTPMPPVVNQNPQIVTTSLAAGTYGVPYRGIIRGRDVDLNDSLKFVIPNLPSGLSLQDCYTDYKLFKGFANSVSCIISGTPQTIGNFRIDVTLFDQNGGIDQKSFVLTVKAPRGFQIKIPRIPEPVTRFYDRLILRLPAISLRNLFK